MPVAGILVELSAAPLAQYTVVFGLLVLLLILFLFTASAVTSIRSRNCANSATQLHTLYLPLRDLALLFRRLRLLLLLSLSLFF